MFDILITTTDANIIYERGISQKRLYAYQGWFISPERYMVAQIAKNYNVAMVYDIRKNRTFYLGGVVAE